MHLGSGQVEAWQPAAQKKRCSPAVLPTLPGAAAERSLAVEARFRSMTRAPERRSRRDGNAKIADNQVQMLLTLQRVFCRRRPILRGHGRTGMIRFWIDLFSGTQILDPQVLVLRTRRTVQQRYRFAHFALHSARVGTLDRSLLSHPQIPKTSLR